MFGLDNVTSVKQVKQIAEGWANDLLKRENELYESRMKICRKCPLYDEESDRCDAKKCYNPKTGEIASHPFPGAICGCNCYMSKKTRVPESHCVLNKW